MKLTIHLLALLVILILATGAQAQGPPGLLVYEPFDYAPYNPIWCLDTGGEGWAGPWERVAGDDAIIRADNLDYLGLSEIEGTHCAVEFVLNGVRYNRPIPAIEDEGQTVWVSTVINVRPGAHPNNVGNITLIENGAQVFTFGRKFGIQRFGVVWPGVTNYNTEISTQGLHWMVVKIQFSGDSGPEQAWFWVDPDPMVEPMPASAHISIPQAGMANLTLNNGFNGVQLKVEGTAPLRVDYDELRIGDNFAAVNPFLFTPTRDLSVATHFTIFPNPAQAAIQWQWQQVQPATLRTELYDLTGRLWLRTSRALFAAGQQHGSFDLTSLALPAGTYVLRLTDGYSNVTRQFVYQP